MSRSILIVLAPGHCGLPGNKLTDHQVKLGAAETQLDSALFVATWRTLIRRSCRPPPIQHEQLMEVYASLPDVQAETSFSKTERTNLVRFRSGHHPALRRWLHSVRVSEDDVRRLSGEEVESAEHAWLQCPALLVESHHSGIGHTMDELVRLPRAASALLRIILRHL